MNGGELSWVEVSRTPDRRVARHHALVLQARGIPHGLVQAEGTWRVVVRADFAPPAAAELARYEQENRGWPPREAPTVPLGAGVHTAIVYGGLLVLCFVLQTQRRFGIDWLAAGRVEAEAVRAGEWWRALTALTLHADLSHLAGNLVFGAAFGLVLAQSLGVALAWWGFLLSGALGNLLNALVQDAAHRSIGASTAVFGALGMQAAYEWRRRGELRYRGWRRWAPVVMGLGLMAWLGTGGATPQDPDSAERALARVDIGAHILGFASGALLGLLCGLRPAPWWLRPRTQLLLTLAVPVALAGAWALAIAHSGGR